MTDAELIQEIINGNEDSLRKLIKHYEPVVAATVIGMIGKCPEAEDVGQETFIRFYKSLNNFRGSSSIGTYITRIAINLSLNELKRRKRQNWLFLKKENDELDIHAENFHNNGYDENKAIVHQAIQKLEPNFRSVIVLRLLDGYSTSETAEVLNVPIGTVLSRLSRAQKKLKELLEPLLGDGR